MNKKDFAIFASALRTYYPKEKLLPNEQAMELWYNQLQDIPYQVAEAVLIKWVATNKWSPSIAEIREQAAAIVSGETKDWGEAWESVVRAIRYYGSYKEDEALESLDEVTRQTVKQLGFKNLCFSEELNIERANFRMIYEQNAKRQKERSQLPPKYRELLSKVTLMIGEGDEV